MQDRSNFKFASVTEHVNNQTNCHIALEKLKKMDLSRIHLDVSRYGQKLSEFCLLELKAVNDIGFLRSITTWKVEVQ